MSPGPRLRKTGRKFTLGRDELKVVARRKGIEVKKERSPRRSKPLLANPPPQRHTRTVDAVPRAGPDLIPTGLRLSRAHALADRLHVAPQSGHPTCVFVRKPPNTIDPVPDGPQ